jgi:hypothetical protein
MLHLLFNQSGKDDSNSTYLFHHTNGAASSTAACNVQQSWRLPAIRTQAGV